MLLMDDKFKFIFIALSDGRDSFFLLFLSYVFLVFRFTSLSVLHLLFFSFLFMHFYCHRSMELSVYKILCYFTFVAGFLMFADDFICFSEKLKLFFCEI